MNSTHNASSLYKVSSLAFILGDPGERDRILYETERRYRSEHEPEKPPKWTPGDSRIALGAIIGLIAGGVLGAIAGNHYFGLAGVFTGFIVGIIAGGIIGASIGSLIRKKR
jgi:hypothetical protein